MKNKKIKYYHWGLLVFLTFCACITFYYLLFHGSEFKSGINAALRGLRPILYGIAIAYILNPIMKHMEEKWIGPVYNKLYSFINEKYLKNKDINRENTKKTIRFISLFLTMGLFLFFIYGIIMLIVPQLIESIQSIIIRLPMYFTRLDIWFSGILANNPYLENIFDDYWPDLEQWFIKEVLPSIKDLLSYISSDLLGSVFEVVDLAFDCIIGIIVSIYLLSNKDIYGAHGKKVCYAFMSEERANNLINNGRFANKMFGGFLSGKLVDSLIIGIICFVCLNLLKIPYSLLISVIIGITNIIPFFGPFLGAIPSAFFLLMVEPVKALIFLIFVVVLQQFDGNILGPKILSDSTGLSSFWVIFAITLFGGLFGVVGMFIGVPVFAIIYAAIKTFINKALEKKGLPTDTDYYLNTDYHSEEFNTVSNHGNEFRFVKKAFDKVHVENNKINDRINTIINKKSLESAEEDDNK